jgi:Domain of unknown function (DUF4192)
VAAELGPYSSEDEVFAIVEADHARAAELLPLLAHTKPLGCRRAVWTTFNAAQRVGAGDAVGDTELAAIGESLVDREVRETLLGAVFDGELPDSDALWQLLARVLPNPWRAQALAMVAAAAMNRGDAVLVEAAVAVAMEDLADARDELNPPE